MSSTPPAASASASETFCTQTPTAPAAICSLRDLRALVRLRVRPQAQAVLARKAGHARDVAFERVEVDHQRRRLDRGERVAGARGRRPHAARLPADRRRRPRRVRCRSRCELVVPADEREALGAVEQPVDARVAELPGARRLQADARRRAVQAVHHAAMGDERDRLAGVARRQPRRAGHAARVEGGERLAALGAEVGVALAPAPRQRRPALLDLGVGLALEDAETALAQSGVGDDAEAAVRRRRPARCAGRAAGRSHTAP